MRVHSKTGKFPPGEASVWYEAGTKQVPGERQVEMKPGNPPMFVGHAPFPAMPEDAPRTPAYSPTTAATFGSASAASTVGFVKKAIWSGVNCKVPRGRPTCVVSNGVSPKLPWPMLENPVSCRRVVSDRKSTRLN